MQWNLIILRKESGLSQVEMAKMLKITAETYSLKERGLQQFKADEMFFVSRYFEKPMEQIFLSRNFGNTEHKAK